MVPADPAADKQPDPLTARTALRRSRIAARDAMGAEDQARASTAIENHLADLLATWPAGVIAFCWPIRSEFDARPLVGRLLAGGWRACQPVALEPAAPMDFRAWTPGDAMDVDRYGIPIPAAETPLEPDVILLPLVAFDEAGYRLGYGGGYFDRTLAVLSPRPFAIGVGFELGRVDSIVPGDHDIRLDAVVTEAGVRRFGRCA